MNNEFSVAEGKQREGRKEKEERMTTGIFLIEYGLG